MRTLRYKLIHFKYRHNRRKNITKWRRIVSMALCLCMMSTFLSDFEIFSLVNAAKSRNGSPSDYVMNRVADPDTMDDYVDRMISDTWGSRYAGRVWTDKSVFAYGNNNSKIMLDLDTDGYAGSVGFNADFGHVFSALASSQVINEYPPSPIDLVILIDMSGSMAMDIVDSSHTHSDYNQPNSLRVSHSRIYAVLQSINESIQYVMDMGETNRVSVIGYGATAYTLLELGHYSPGTDGKYLEVSRFRTYGGNNAPSSNGNNSASYLVGTVSGVTKENEEGNYVPYNRYARNDYLTNKLSSDPAGTVNIGYHTDLQAGIYQGFEELYKHYNDKSDVTTTYTSEKTGTKTVVQRIPVAIVMTDGGSNYALKPTTGNATGDEWHNVPVRSGGVTSYGGAWKKYRTESLEGDKVNGTPTYNRGGDATILDILMTASYEKSKVQKKYAKLVQDARDANELQDERYKGTDFRILTVSVDTPDNEWQKPRVYTSLDPSHFFSDTAQQSNGIDANSWAQKEDVFKAYRLFQSWKTSNSAVSVTFRDSDMNQTVKFNQLPAVSSSDPTAVTKNDIVNNINYNSSFADISSAGLTDTFKNMLNEIRGIAFSPLSGDNASGVADSITYQDPLGEYMELKNQAIETEVHGKDKGTYDMSLLVFGKMHGMVRAGVYDYQWNDKYMKAKNPTYAGEYPFDQGWYRGDDPATAEKAKNVVTTLSGTYPDGYGYTSAEEAWEDGWVMRFNFQTLLSFVPIADAPESGLPQDLSEQVKNTVYTCYRFAGTQQERNELHRNPIFGEVPESLIKEWNEYYEKNQVYPADDGMYSTYEGVYRLSDIRVWAENIGDFIDTDGAITPEDKSSYDDSLYVNIPVAAVPTQLAEVTVGPDGPIAYKDNLADKTQSTPFRLFYAVGLTEDLILRDEEGTQTGVNISAISGEYLREHTNTDNSVWFISNYYSNTAYTGYTSDEAESRTRGDAAVSFSPSVENRYYLFQKPLPLYAHAYRVKNGEIVPVDRAETEKWKENGSGNGSTTWENGESAATWSGGEFIGTYKSIEDFQSKRKEAKETGYITDGKGFTYPYTNDGKDCIILLEDDELDKITSNEDGSYTKDSISFSSDDYFFLCTEYYLPIEGQPGVDINGDPVKDTTACRKMTRVIARKGSAFGSGLHSENIDNGDMLCWSDINGNCTIEIEYNSRTDTGDNTRGEPTFEKLTLTGEDLKTYLKNCGLKDDNAVTDPENGTILTKSSLEQDYDYWTSVQAESQMAALIEQIKSAENPQMKYNELFDWAVSARTGGIRVGDMFNNIQAKGGGGELTDDGFYKGNKTQTANNYYIPTLSETSTAGNGLVINNFLGNNGRLSVANQNLMVTKTLVAPNGFTLTANQLDKEFNYQVYIQSTLGMRQAQRIAYNPFSGTWQKKIASLDILTDNSSLLLDTDSNRALFCYKDGIPRQIVAQGTNGDSHYVYADASGNPTSEECGEANEHNFEDIYYLYLPSAGEEDTRSYHLFGSTYNDGTEEITGAGTTAYYPSEMGNLPATSGSQLIEQADGSHTAGSRDYWSSVAELIPYNEVQTVEASNDLLPDDTGGSFSLMALESENSGSNRWDHDTNHGESTTDHVQLERFTLLTVIPSTDGTTNSTVYSPYSSRTQYMTVDLYFGYKAELADYLKEENKAFTDCTTEELNAYKLTADDLYDQNIPSDWTTSSGAPVTPDGVAGRTAEFTLKSGEGLLLTGLNNPRYRFTEKLDNEDLELGYTLKNIRHVTNPATGASEHNHELSEFTVPGVYSVFDSVGNSEEQAHYTNTYDPDALVVSKTLEGENGTPITDTDKSVEFSYTVSFKLPDWVSDKAENILVELPYWKGKTADKNKEVSEGGAPRPSEDDKIAALTHPDGEPQKLKPDKNGIYSFTLKADESIAIYGLPIGTTYTVKEVRNKDYPVKGEASKSESDPAYTKNGTIQKSDDTIDEHIKNIAEFTNIKPKPETGSLTVEKEIENDDPDKEKEFGFTITLTPPAGSELNKDSLVVTTTDETGAKVEQDVTWTESGDGKLNGSFKLKHKDKITVEGIPYGTSYTVSETGSDGYNLQRVEDKNKEIIDYDKQNKSVSGNIVEEQANVYMKFVNGRTAFYPFSGGLGWTLLYVLAFVILTIAIIVLIQKKRHRILGCTVDDINEQFNKN